MTEYQKIVSLSRILVQDASFLTVREKHIFLDFLLNLKTDDGEIFSDEKSFEKRFLTLVQDDISFAVKRTFRRVSWKADEALKKAKIAEKIIYAQNIKSTCILDSDFPPLLREMKDPPFMLFYRGNLEILQKRCVSVVGTRRATPSALQAASDFSKDACDDGRCVVSGLAWGIDAASHKGALLSQNASTCAVLPSGIDTITPASHKKLAAKILEKGGLILSEYLPGTPAANFRFVERNRIVAALSPVTVVVQAPSGSGAMITAGLALDYNREVLFHSECFSSQAKQIDSLAIERLEKSIIAGKKVSYKLENSPKKYVDDGANIISSYEDLTKLLQ